MHYIHSVYYTRLMKYLLILTITAFGHAVSAQDLSMYADQFRFNGNPQQVKLYYLSEGENGKPHWREFGYCQQQNVILHPCQKK